MTRSGTILVTGATGALGPPLVAELLPTWKRVAVVVRDRAAAVDAVPFDRVLKIEGDVRNAELSHPMLDPRSVEAVIHAAADTRFRSTRDQLEAVNVRGTENVLAWARKFPKLSRFVHVSTACVAGTRTGQIAETIDDIAPGFVNDYEASKWRAEQRVRVSGLPVTIARLSTAIGSNRDGSIHRAGAIHRAIQWLSRGLVPMLPGANDTPFDLISTELAASCLARCAAANDAPDVLHIAAGQRAVPLAEVIDLLVEAFRAISPAWRQGQIRRPLIVDRETFDLFRDSIHRSGDVLFRTVLDSTSAFLPGLLYPKRFETVRAEALFGGPLPLCDWRGLLRRVTRRCVDGDGPVVRAREVSHV